MTSQPPRVAQLEKIAQLARPVVIRHQTSPWEQDLLLLHLALIDLDNHPLARPVESGRCRVCGCTADDCTACVEATGEPCSWATAEHTLCTRCTAAAGEATT